MSGLRRFADGPAPAPDAPPPGQTPEVLRRLVAPRPQPPPGETCELCAEAIGDDHRHVVDVEGRSIECVCRPCALLFTDGKAALGRYKTVSDRMLALRPFVVDPQAWAALQIPVGIAFFLVHSKLETTVAFYPSPGGATESELPLDAWQTMVADNPMLAELEPDVEAALVRVEADTEPACYLVPVDRCYELVGELRLHWRGFDGGQEVRAHLAAFFDDIEARAKPVRAGGTAPGPPGAAGEVA